MTMNKMLSKLRAHNKGNYVQFLFCVTLSVMLITSFSVVLYSKAVQNTLPVGGDSRKQIYMIFAVALIGSYIFTIYSVGLFLKYKSREIGVFLALGTPKSRLLKALLVETVQLIFYCIAAGLLLGGAVSFIIWQLFRMFLSNTEQMAYQFSPMGYLIGFAFGIIVMITVIIQIIRFMKRTNMMDILYEQRKSEPLKPVTKLYEISGITFLFFGILLGYGVPNIVSTFGKLMPSYWSITYLLSLIGIYRIITYAVVYNKRGKNPQKYYKNIISTGMMKFQGKQTVRNMCIIALLLAASLFASFYPLQLFSSADSVNNSPIDFAINYKLSENQLEKEDLYQIAEQYSVAITEYQEVIFSELLGSGIERDWDDSGNFIEDYYELYQYFEFINVSAYNELTKDNLDIRDGSYYVIKSPETSDGFWVKFNDLDSITNPITDKNLSVSFAGTVDCQQLVNNGPTRYILSDKDYSLITNTLTLNRQIRQILFNTEDADNSYEFSKAVYREFLRRASDKMAVMRTYDEYQEYLAISAGKAYSYNEPMELTEDNPDLMEYWKYYPVMKVLIGKTFFQNLAIFFLVFIYVAIICLAAVGIISYTRSVTIGLSNKHLFDDLKRLGANHKYIIGCITRQMNKIFILPTIIASILMYAFTLLMLWGNDGNLAGTDMKAIILDICIGLLIFLYQYSIYRASLKKIKKIIGI